MGPLLLKMGCFLAYKFTFCKYQVLQQIDKKQFKYLKKGMNGRLTLWVKLGPSLIVSVIWCDQRYSVDISQLAKPPLVALCVLVYCVLCPENWSLRMRI